MAKETDNNRCSFCGRSSEKAGLLIAGLNASICEDCIEDAMAVLDEMYGRPGKNESRGSRKRDPFNSR